MIVLKWIYLNILFFIVFWYGWTLSSNDFFRWLCVLVAVIIHIGLISFLDEFLKKDKK